MINYQQLANDPEVRAQIAQIPVQVKPRRAIMPKARTIQRKCRFKRLGPLRIAAMTAILNPDSSVAQLLHVLLKSKSRKSELVKLRHEAMRLLSGQGYTSHEIGSFLRRDRSIVSYVLNKKN